MKRYTDKQRFDWINKNILNMLGTGTTKLNTEDLQGLVFSGKSWRQAIDAAIVESEKHDNGDMSLSKYIEKTIKLVESRPKWKRGHG